MLLRPNLFGKLTFLLSALNFFKRDFFSVNKQITIITLIMQTQAKFCLCITKINAKPFLYCTNATINMISLFLT